MSIPEIYHSEYEGRPFQACTRCGESLAALRQGYQIVKCWHNNDVIYEYVLCTPCHDGLVASFSEESRERLAEYHADRLQSGLAATACATCICPAEDITDGEYSLTGLFLGPKLQQEVLVCGDCTRTMQGLMSDHTRRVWDAFVEENFPSPPADVIVPEPILA
jgi:hypothetical protein